MKKIKDMDERKKFIYRSIGICVRKGLLRYGSSSEKDQLHDISKIGENKKYIEKQ